MSEAVPTHDRIGAKDAVMYVPSFLMQDLAAFLRDEFRIESRRGGRYAVEEFIAKQFGGSESVFHRFLVEDRTFEYVGFPFDGVKVWSLEDKFPDFFGEGLVEIHKV